MSSTPQRSREITHWLEEWDKGDVKAGEARGGGLPGAPEDRPRFLNNERAGHTLERNALVHELWMRLVGNDAIAFQNRAHFRAVAAQTIRRTLKDHVCPESETSEGTGDSKFSLTAVEGCNPTTRDDDLLDLDQAPTKLAGADPRAARVVELRFFGGLQENEVAEALGVSLITVKRDWKVTHAWLVNRLTKRQG